jgi:hypothetical protein
MGSRLPYTLLRPTMTARRLNERRGTGARFALSSSVVRARSVTFCQSPRTLDLRQTQASDAGGSIEIHSKNIGLDDIR